MQKWNKTITHNLVTDYNVDEAVHILLFVMAKNNLLSNYLIDLVQKDIEQNHKTVFNETFCEKLVLKEMGYKTSENEDSLKAIKDLVFNLEKKREKREESLDKEKLNQTAKLFENNSSTNKEEYESNKEAKKETQNIEEQVKTVDCKIAFEESKKILEHDTQRKQAIDNIL